jgi:uncharacterized phage protein gp47/JayE
MSYVAEPYAQFVDDLLTGLTGGHVRETFRMLAEEAPFRLSAETGIKPGTVRVYGQKENIDGSHIFHRFIQNIDFELSAGRDVVWKTKQDGLPATDAVWPVEGTIFYVNYESARTGFEGPLLTDRSPGSVTRLLAESIGREYAVLSGQLEKVYQAGFLETATGRDLDNIVSLVGLTRWGRDVAEGSVTFSRGTPAPADITISSGTRLTTGDAPARVFETSATVTLQRGQLSVDAPIQARAAGSDGIVDAGAIVAINRPVLGIDAVSNDEPTAFAAQKESDAALRLRARRALESAGQATVGALLGVLTGLPGVREKDIRFSEDPIEHPGIVNLDIALPQLSTEKAEDYKRSAIQLLEETRPVGVRIRHTIEAALPLGTAVPSGGQDTSVGDGPPVSTATLDQDLHMYVDANVVLQPLLQNLTPGERESLVSAAKTVVERFIGEAGLGETLVYNQLIAQLMTINGVLDVALELFPTASPSGPRTQNVLPGDVGARPVVGTIDVQIGNSLVALDLQVSLVLEGAGTIGNEESNIDNALKEIQSDLQKGLNQFTGSQIDPVALLNMIPASTTFQVTQVSYDRVEYLDAGLRVDSQDIPLPYTGLERFWVRSVKAADTTAGG